MENNQKELILLQDLGLQYITVNSNYKKRYGLYKCHCGVQFKARIENINSKNTKSCGCLNTKRRIERCKNRATHKLRSHRLYNIWHLMMNRCYKENNKSYADYGLRNIKVCEQWHNVENFIHDMNDDYKDGLSIDRINNDKGYFKDNCRWVNRTIQARNKRTIQKNNTSGYKGVFVDGNRFRVLIGVNNKRINIGSFKDIVEAAKAYDRYVIDNNLEHTLNGVL
jgi:hypothetical protein